jgi:hypothetical protein
MKLWYESPVAKNLNMTANLVLLCMDSYLCLPSIFLVQSSAILTQNLLLTFLWNSWKSGSCLNVLLAVCPFCCNTLNSHSSKTSNLFSAFLQLLHKQHEHSTHFHWSHDFRLKIALSSKQKQWCPTYFRRRAILHALLHVVLLKERQHLNPPKLTM